MKKKIALLLALNMLVGLLSGCGKEKQDELEKIKEQGYITCSTSPDNAPYEFEDLTKTGQDSIVGADISLAYYIADYIGVDLKIEAMDFSTCQASVQSGAVDFSIAGYGITDERAETYNLSDPYRWEDPNGQEQGLVVLKSDADKYNSAEDFSGKKVAVQNGSLQMNLVLEQLPDCEVEAISSLNDGILSLLNGKVDAVAIATDTATSYCENYSDLSMANWYFDYTSSGSTILIKKGNDSLTKVINEAIAKATEEGKFAQWRDEAKALSAQLGLDQE